MSRFVKYPIQTAPIHLFFNPNVEHVNDASDYELFVEIAENMPFLSSASLSITQYKNVVSNIIRHIKHTRYLCKGLNPNYVNDSLQNADAVILAKSTGTTDSLFGFATIQFDLLKNGMHVDVICSHNHIKGGGKLLLSAIETLGAYLSMSKIHLVSVSSAISFYEKYGFIKQSTDCEDMCHMLKKIPRLSAQTFSTSTTIPSSSIIVGTGRIKSKKNKRATQFKNTSKNRSPNCTRRRNKKCG